MRRFKIVVTLNSGKIIQGERIFTGTQVDPYDYYYFKASKHYKREMKSCKVTEIFELSNSPTGYKKRVEPNRAELGSRNAKSEKNFD